MGVVAKACPPLPRTKEGDRAGTEAPLSIAAKAGTQNKSRMRFKADEVSLTVNTQERVSI